jgi:low temperature requirement protein LtrA
VIIVLGESIVLTGATATDVGLTSSVVVALGVAFLSSVAMWWLYFGQAATSAVRRIAADEAPGRVGRDAYTHLHLPIVAGILLTAVGDELVITHPGDELGTAGALAVLGGPALDLLGLVAFGTRVGRRQPWTRTAGAVVLVACVPLGAEASGLVVAAVASVLLIGSLLTDTRWAVSRS